MKPFSPTYTTEEMELLLQIATEALPTLTENEKLIMNSLEMTEIAGLSTATYIKALQMMKLGNINNGITSALKEQEANLDKLTDYATAALHSLETDDNEDIISNGDKAISRAITIAFRLGYISSIKNAGEVTTK